MQAQRSLKSCTEETSSAFMQASFGLLCCAFLEGEQTKLCVVRKDTCDKADHQTDECISGNEIELRLRLRSSSLPGGRHWALAVEAVDDGQLGKIAEEALR